MPHQYLRSKLLSFLLVLLNLYYQTIKLILLFLLNQHPNQFQNVDPYFFSNTLEKMRSTIETQKALKRVRLEEARKKADQARLQAARRRGGGGIGMMRIF